MCCAEQPVSRGSRLPQNNVAPAKILHLPKLKKRIVPDMLSVADRWSAGKRFEDAALLRQYIGAKYGKMATQPG
jgi:hypothetical protein